MRQPGLEQALDYSPGRDWKQCRCERTKNQKNENADTGAVGDHEWYFDVSVDILTDSTINDH